MNSEEEKPICSSQHYLLLDFSSCLVGQSFPSPHFTSDVCTECFCAGSEDPHQCTSSITGFWLCGTSLGRGSVLGGDL